MIGLIPGYDILLGDFKKPHHVCLQFGSDLDFSKEYSLISAMNISSLISHWSQCWSHQGWYGLISYLKLVAATTTLQAANQSKKYLVCMHQHFNLPIYIYIYKMGWLLYIYRRVCAYYAFIFAITIQYYPSQLNPFHS